MKPQLFHKQPAVLVVAAVLAFAGDFAQAQPASQQPQSRTGMWSRNPAVDAVPEPGEAAPGVGRSTSPIPLDQVGTVARKQYSGDGLSVAATDGGALLRCVFQRMNGRATAEGLWITSTVDRAKGEPFRVKAVAVGRQGASRTFHIQRSTSNVQLKPVGVVEVVDKLARFVRSGLTEEYSVSMDGLRQDFVIAERPAGEGQLRVELAVDGAKAEPRVGGARLVLADGGREIAYSRLRATDALGKELSAKMEVLEANRLAIVLDDAAAEYPVRIDPTFSDADWFSLGGIPGANATVNATALDGAGNLYIGGDFTLVGDVFANRVAKWNGSAWSALGSGVDNTVCALTVAGTNLYTGGYFTTAGGVTANYIARWDGTSWSALGSGMSGSSAYPYYGGRVLALAVSGNDLFAGGSFTNAGGVTANRIAKWDGTSWLALGSGMNGNEFTSVYALAISGTNLFAGGSFTNAGGVTVSRVAQWDGNAWSALGLGVNNTVSALAVSGTNLYVGGAFTIAGGFSASRIARWNGSAWSALGLGVDNSVSALAVSGTIVYAGGGFNTAGGVSASQIARWDGSSWSALGLGMDSQVRALAVSGASLYAGGEFSSTGGVSASRIAQWNGNAWSALGSGMNGSVHELVVSGADLYAGGYFTSAGGVSANYIAKWNGSSWSALGSGMDGSVSALVASGMDLYAGGYFTTAGGVPANSIAKWNGSSWSALGTGIDGSVSALAVSGSNLYAGGNFTTAGGVSANQIAKWDGSSWSALGTGMNYDVAALAVSGTSLYAGGSFTTAGGVSASRIAKWDGISWSALGSGMNSGVSALAVSGGDVYAGGAFYNAGGISANYIAKWNGASWSALGLGMNSAVSALAVSGTDLFAGGYSFTTAGGLPANRIAKWDGSSWSALGSGMDGGVAALAVSGSNVFAGGEFTAAGGKVSAYAARGVVEYDAPHIGLGQPVSQTAMLGDTANFNVTAAGAAPLSYQWRRYGTNLLDGGRYAGVTNASLFISNVQTNDAGSYSVVVTNTFGSMTSSNATLWVAYGGGMDPSFTLFGSLTGINTPVWAVVEQPDGKVLVGGEFTYVVAGVTRRYLMRLDEGGALDTSFSPTNGAVQCVALQNDGKVLIAGGFTTVHGVPINHLARLNANGMLDTSFQSGLVTAGGIPGGPVGGIAVQPDGRVVIGGTFSTVHGVTRNNIARLNADGTLDTTFQDGLAGITGSAGPVLVQPDGKVLVGGSFTKVNGVVRNGIARLNADGTLDDTFMSGLAGTEAGATVYCLALQPDGKVLVGGTFLRVHGWSVDCIARLDPNGTLDTTFWPEANGYVHSLALQPDGRILLGGQFSAVNDVPRSLLARLDPSGTLDMTLAPSVSGGSYPKVVTIAVDDAGKVIIGGAFTNVNGQAANCLARLWGGAPLRSPLITSQPAGQDLASGMTANFAVTAIGDPPLGYQWRRDGTNLGNGARIAGATSSSLTISGVQPSDSGSYTVVVSNLWGSATSTPPALLTVDQPPMILAQPQSQSASLGSNATFSVSVGGLGPFSFQWFKDGVPLTEGGRLTGTQTSTLSISNVAVSDAGLYQVTVGNAFGTTRSTPAMLYVPPCRFIGNIASSHGWARRVVVSGNLAYVANTKDLLRTTMGSLDIVDVSNPTNLVRRGSFNAVNDVNAVAVSGNRAYLARAYAEPMGLSILDVSNPAAPSLLGHYGSYSISGHGTDVAVSGTRAYLAAGSSLRILDVSTPASPLLLGGWTNSYSSDEVVVSGDFAYFGSSGLHVIKVNNPANCVRVGGAASSPSGVALAGSVAYMHGGQGLRIYDVSNPSNVVFLANSDVGNVSDMAFSGRMAYAAGGDDGLRLLDLSEPANPVTMGNCATRGTAQGVAVSGGFVYVADGAAGLSVYSLEQGAAPVLSEHPQGQLVAVGGSTVFSVAANGDAPLHYQWMRGNTPLDGATNSILWLTNVQPAQAGHYVAIVTNAYGTATSGVAVLTVSVPPRLDIRWRDGLPQLELTGTVGYAYAVEYVPHIPWTNAWIGLTNAILTSATWLFTDASGPHAQQRYYRARQLESAPDSLAGKTIVATVTNVGPFTVTLAYAAGTFTQANGSETQYGVYYYIRTGPVTALINDQTTAPPEVAGNTSATQLTFTSATGGTFVNNSFTTGDPVETAIGTFQIGNSP